MKKTRAGQTREPTKNQEKINDYKELLENKKTKGKINNKGISTKVSETSV